MAVHVEKQGPVTTVILSRPEARNAVDRETAQALAEALAGATRFAQGAGRHGSFTD